MSADRPTIHMAEPPINLATGLSQKRRRPLRTYGRRSTQARESALGSSGEEDSYRCLNSDLGRAESVSELTRLPRQESWKSPKRRSILAYFKPLPSNSDTAGSDLLSSSLVQPAPTPLLSPPPSSKPRKRRRLTTRPQFGEEESFLKDGTEVDGTRNDFAMDGDCPQSHNPPPIDTKNAIQDTVRSTLGGIAAGSLNRGNRSAGDRAEQGHGVRKPPRKRSARDMMQTTLSLSVHKDPGFTVCTVCDILYNPFNEKDRREHRRRHAAYSRTKSKASGAGICEDSLEIPFPN